MKNRPLPLASLVGLAFTFRLCVLTAPAANPTTPFELREGDRVVLVGDTLIEREQTHGFIESELTARFPERHVIFRNLGWSADTPGGRSRVSFDWNKSPEEWFRQLTNQVAATKPTVVVLGYGLANSFDGEAGVLEFEIALKRLIDAIQSNARPTPVRFLLLSPIRHERLLAPMPDPAKHNDQLQLYAKVIERIARELQHSFISLFDAPAFAANTNPSAPITDNGIHLNEQGYYRAAEVIAAGLGWPIEGWRISLNASAGAVPTTRGIDVNSVDQSGGQLRFQARARRLPPARSGLPASVARERGVVQISGLQPGRYALRVDGIDCANAAAGEWAEGRVLDVPPDLEQAEKLRETIRLKNQLFFYRWRPQNQTYLFGFRNHEQGQNAREVPLFDPLVDEQENSIAQLRKPIVRRFELVRTEAAAAGAQFKPTGAVVDAKSAAPLPVSKPQATPAFEVAPGFEVTLFAENPQLAKPIQINFDSRGRLWVASSAVYPQIKPGQLADDKILIIEDTDGDGKSDKSTVFADGLLIPTGVEPGDGGAYVGQSTELLHFKDTDGDGKADQRKVVLSSFGTEDTHHILHTLRWGPDGQLYFNQSIYIHTHIETPHGVVRLNSGGVFNFRPPTQELEVFLRGFCNPWGHHFDRFGQSFVTDGAGFQGVSFGIPGAMYFTYAGGRRLLESVSPGNYPKFCGLEFVESPQFPDEFQGNLITCDFRAHRVVRFAVEEQGSAYVTRELPDLLRTTDVTFRPIDVKFGPDGALYIADWSNPIIQHGEVDFRDPRRDHDHGRIWRVAAKGRPVVAPVPLVDAPAAKLLDLLNSANGWTRLNARRVLTERGVAIAPDLHRWVGTQTAERSLLEALWMYQSIDRVEPVLLKRLLSAQDGKIRAASTRVLGFWQARLPDAMQLLAARVADEHSRVRIEAVRALSRIASARAAELVLSALDRPLDSHLEYAVWLSINDLAREWLAALESGQWKQEGREKQFEYALRAIDPVLASSGLGRLLGGRPIARDGSGPGIELIGQAGGPKELGLLFGQLVRREFDDPAAVRALGALVQAARVRKAVPPADLAGISSIFDHGNSEVRAQAVRLAGLWKQAQLTPKLLDLAGQPSVSTNEREAAFQSLADIGGSDVISGLQALLAKVTETSVRRRAVLALAPLNLDAAARPAVEVLSGFPSDEEAVVYWRSLLNVRGGGAAIARALPKGDLPAVLARSGLRAAREGNRKENELLIALSRSSVEPTGEEELTMEQLQALAARVTKEGDPRRGEQVYRRKELGCLICHAIGGAGGRVGPDMTSIGASAPVDYLIESLLYPNRKIKEGYHSVVVETDDGQELSGVLVKETGEQLVIRDATNREVSIPRASVKNRRIGGSLMPSGLIDQLSSAERLDLFRFLAALGKPGEFDAAKGNVARTWRIRAGTHTVEQFGEDRIINGSLADREWNQVFTLVDGRLPKGEFEEAAANLRYTGIVAFYAAAVFQAPKPGAVRLQISVPAGTTAWIDGRSVPVSAVIAPNLSAGTHRLVLKLDPRKLAETIRVESPDVTFLGP